MYSQPTEEEEEEEEDGDSDEGGGDVLDLNAILEDYDSEEDKDYHMDEDTDESEFDDDGDDDANNGESDGDDDDDDDGGDGGDGGDGRHVMAPETQRAHAWPQPVRLSKPEFKFRASQTNPNRPAPFAASATAAQSHPQTQAPPFFGGFGSK